MAQIMKGNWPEKPPTSSGSGGPGMEARVAKLEAAVEHIQTDISDIKIDLREMRSGNKEDMTSLQKSINTDLRWFFGIFIASTVGLAGLMAKGFNWI